MAKSPLVFFPHALYKTERNISGVGYVLAGTVNIIDRLYGYCLRNPSFQSASCLTCIYTSIELFIQSFPFNFFHVLYCFRILIVCTLFACYALQSLCSEFVAIPNIQEVLLRGRPDSTDLSMSMSLSMSHTSTSSIKELNSSWSSLQAQVYNEGVLLKVHILNRVNWEDILHF